VRIEDWMKFPVHAVRPLDSIARARAVLEQYRINQLPVVVDNRLVGIITDRDLRSVSPSVAEVASIDAGTVEDVLLDPEKTSVEQVMSARVVSLGPKDTVEEATRLLISERIGAVPVVENERLVGIITRSDVLGAFLGLVASGGILERVKSARGSQAKATRSKNTKPKVKKAGKPKTNKSRRPTAKKSPQRKRGR
jgi:acetoin utilization protein AcuB